MILSGSCRFLLKVVVLVPVLVLAGASGASATFPPSGPSNPAPERADLVVVRKTDRTMSLVRGGKAIRTYRIALGANPSGGKSRAGDGRTPEGRYVIDYRNPNSRFHRSLHISYPSSRDRARAKASGASPGGDIMVHGLPKGAEWIGGRHSLKDWTKGCIAVTNAEMDEIWAAVPDGTPIVIRP